MNTTVLILPGFGNSEPLHWQSLWEQSNPGFLRVQQRDWNNPVCEEWVVSLERAVHVAGPHVILVAHSLACLVVAHWAAKPHAAVKGALLVAVPDPASPHFPGEARGFSETPTQPLPFRSTVVASADDPYGSRKFSERLAQAWGSQFVNIGNRGHINADSGLGSWPEGFELLRRLQDE